MSGLNHGTSLELFTFALLACKDAITLVAVAVELGEIATYGSGTFSCPSSAV